MVADEGLPAGGHVGGPDGDVGLLGEVRPAAMRVRVLEHHETKLPGRRAVGRRRVVDQLVVVRAKACDPGGERVGGRGPLEGVRQPGGFDLLGQAGKARPAG
jgi:hypothetical protein